MARTAAGADRTAAGRRRVPLGVNVAASSRRSGARPQGEPEPDHEDGGALPPDGASGAAEPGAAPRRVRARRASGALSADAGLLAALLDEMDTALCAFDADGVVTHWNREAELLLGWSAREVVGREGFGGWAVRDEDAAALRERLLAAARRPAALADGGGRLVEEFVLLARDGHRVLVRGRCSRVPAAQGRPAGVYCAFGEAQSQIDLERSLAMSEALLTDTSWGVVLVDADLRPALVNGYAARALGADRAGLPGRPLGDLLLDGAAEVEGALQYVLAEGTLATPVELWVTLRAEDVDQPRRCWRGGFVRLSSPLSDAPVPLGVAWFFHDVTETKQAERDASLLRFRARQLHRAGRTAAECEDPLEAVSLHLEFALAGYADHALLDVLVTREHADGPPGAEPGRREAAVPGLVRAVVAPAAGVDLATAHLSAPAAATPEGAGQGVVPSAFWVRAAALTGTDGAGLPVGYRPEHPAVQAVRRRGAVRASAGRSLPPGWAAARKWPEGAVHSLCTALRSRGRTLGVVTFLRGASRHAFHQADVAYAEDVASRVAAALDLALALAGLPERSPAG
ncbi:PAS domain-containing protein [Streptomyces sp. NPDC059740]|uniref:PAS domain-containing protein n=1 Tax=Streptomyces sp. NPDC059740 TaxID=3346926 RepID=UPI00364AD77A